MMSRWYQRLPFLTWLSSWHRGNYELASAEPSESGAVFQGKKDGSDLVTHVEMEVD